MENLNQLFDFIDCSPTAFHTVRTCAAMMRSEGYTELFETEKWVNLKPGGRYFVTRSMSSLIAFRIPEERLYGFSIVAPHGDSPCFRVKGSPEMQCEKHYTKLNTEIYGGTDPRLWFDRPLSVAGRLIVETENGVEAKLVDIKRDLMVIPSLAPHMGGGAKQQNPLDPQRETLPLFGAEDRSLIELLAQAAGVEREKILSWDISLYNRSRGTTFGAENEFVLAPKLDDLECAFSAVKSFMAGENRSNCMVCAIFDNEEVGSMTRQGAGSTFLFDVLARIAESLGADCAEAIQRGFMLSADNAHAVHPNYPEKSDPTSRCYLNGGPVIKFGSGYASDGVTAGVFRRICEAASVPVQFYYNHSNVRGGGTLGKISGSHVSIPTVDIGLAQLAMHSPMETGGAKDLGYMIKAMTAFYNTTITWQGEISCVLE